MKLKRINQPPKHHQSIVGSCNELICFSKDGRGPHCSFDYEPTYICNPITGEYVNFPGLPWEEKLQSMVCGFGYHHSSNKYKIVRIYYVENQPLGKVQVYTLGSGIGWKDLGETAYSLWYNWQIHPSGIFANGVLHWLDMEQNIVSFDLAEEKFYLLPPPPFFRAVTLQNYFKFRVFGGCLCFFHQIKHGYLDIWFLRKKGGHSSSDVNEQDYGSLTWIKEFSLPVENGAVPFAVTNSSQILFHYFYGLFCYDPDAAVSDNLISNDFYHVAHVVPHMNSLVSLKGLGEDYCPRKRYDVNPAPKEIFIKQRRKDDGNIDVNPSLPKTRCLGKQVVSPIRAILMTVGLEASHSSKAADRNVGDSRKRKERLLKRKSHCSDRIANSSRQLYSSDENSPLGHRSRGSLFVREKVVLVVHRRLLRMSRFLQIMMEILEKLVEKWAPHCISSLQINNIRMVQT